MADDSGADAPDDDVEGVPPQAQRYNHELLAIADRYVDDDGNEQLTWQRCGYVVIRSGKPESVKILSWPTDPLFDGRFTIKPGRRGKSDPSIGKAYRDRYKRRQSGRKPGQTVKFQDVGGEND